MVLYYGSIYIQMLALVLGIEPSFCSRESSSGRAHLGIPVHVCTHYMYVLPGRSTITGITYWPLLSVARKSESIDGTEARARAGGDHFLAVEVARR